ncbi:MAG: hypothetical protein WDN04_16745 [Rhodospirillales bacterium]
MTQTAYVYQAQPGDSAALVAAALADLIRADQICWLTQATLTVPGVADLVARTTSAVAALEEWGRQEQEFRIAVWAGSPAARDSTASLVMQSLAPVAFLTLAERDGRQVAVSRHSQSRWRSGCIDLSTRHDFCR